MKKLALMAGLLLASTKVFADPTFREIFRKTEGATIDWAIASAVEPGYFRDMINGRNITGAQSPIVYVTPYISADWGYVAGYHEKSRGSLMIGGTLRVNKILEDFFRNQVSFIRALPVVDNNWSRFWLGPFISHNFTNEELQAGIKAGLSF